MSFTDVMYGGLGQVNNTFQNNLAANQAAMQQQAALQANSLAMSQQNQQVVDNLYGPQGFGGQTAQYAAAGAAAGRNVGEPMGSVFDTGTTPYNDYGNPNLGAGQPNYFSGATPIGTLTGGQANDPASMSYLNANPDVAASGMSAYDHYTNYGQNEGRYSYGVENLGGDIPKPMDWGNYFSGITAPHVGGQGGGWEGEYLLANPDVAAAAEKAGGDVNAFADEHYRTAGQAEGRRVFDPTQYLQENPDVAASGMNPFVHFNQYGRGEGRAEPMSGVFDPATYRTNNPDIGGMDPTAHWLQYGQNEGRSGGFAMNEPNTPSWQTAIAKAYRDPAAFEAMQNMAFSQIDPRALAALFSEESGWNPRAQTGQQFGLAQMAKDDFNYRGAGGTLGGKTFDQYTGGSAADQIYSYADLLSRMQAANPGLDFSKMTPQRQYAVLQALNFGPYTGEPGTIDWIKAMNEGNTSMPTTNKPQAQDLGNRSIDAIEQAYLKKQALLPTR